MLSPCSPHPGLSPCRTPTRGLSRSVQLLCHLPRDVGLKPHVFLPPLPPFSLPTPPNPGKPAFLPNASWERGVCLQASTEGLSLPSWLQGMRNRESLGGGGRRGIAGSLWKFSEGWRKVLGAGLPGVGGGGLRTALLSCPSGEAAIGLLLGPGRTGRTAGSCREHCPQKAVGLATYERGPSPCRLNEPPSSMELCEWRGQ